MKKANVSRGEVIMAGIGGMGVLVAGQVLIWAASQQYKHVSYLPSYGMAKRGGSCESTIIFSNIKIASPLLDQAQVVLLLDSSQFARFEPRVRPGGLIIAEKVGLTAERERKDYKLHALPGLQIAVSIGSAVINNLILLGSYVAITGSIPQELVEAELCRRYEDSEKVAARNLDAFRRGVELGKSAK